MGSNKYVRCSEVKINPADVDRIVEILRKFSGPDDTKHVLRYIEWIERKQWHLCYKMQEIVQLIFTCTCYQ